MDKCPYCNSLISDSTIFCAFCGREIMKKSIGIYMDAALNRVKDNPTIIIPGIILSLMRLLPTILIIIVFGRNKIIEYMDLLELRTEVSYSPIFILLIGGILVTNLINILFSPFLTCLYLQIINGESINYKSAYTYFMNRIVEFLKAQIMIIALGILSLTPLGLIYFVSIIQESNIFIGAISGIVFFLYIIALLYIVSALTFTLPIMVIEDVGARNALYMSISFYRDYFWLLVGFGIIINFIKRIVEEIPFNDFYADVIEVFSSLVLIDIFINYRKLESVKLNNNLGAR